mgnify:FL=1
MQLFIDLVCLCVEWYKSLVKNLPNILSFFNGFAPAVFILLAVFFVSDASATVYTSISDGQYDNCNIWDNGCAPNEIQVGDTVIINHDVEASSSMEISGVLIINSTGELSHANDVDLLQSGFLSVDGTLSILAEFDMQGTMYNSGLSIIENFLNQGYVCNSGTIKSSDLIYIQGGHIECGGTLLTCELDMNSYNGATTVTGSPTAELNDQNVCCENSSDPNPFDNLNGSWLIDSVSVQICGEPLIPSAGQDSSLAVCSNGVTQVDLYTLLSSDASSLGGFAETSASGAFNPLTGILTIDGLNFGMYTFTYTVIGYMGVNDVSNFTITVNPTLNVTENIELCSNAFPFEWNGITITEAGTSSVNLISALTGCDSIVTLNTSVLPTSSSSETVTICENDLPYEWNGLTIGQAGSESVVLTSSNGCDSIVTLNLLVNAIPTSSVDTLVCASQFPFSWNGLSINDFGAYEFVSTAANGCDSIANLSVSENQLSAPSVYSSGSVACPKDLVFFEVTDENTNAIYEWFGPNSFSSSEVSNEFELTTDMVGTYGVSYTLNGCSSATTYINLDIDNTFDYQTFKFPNFITANGDGINDEINIEDFVGPCAQFMLTIRDRWGSEVFRQERGEGSFKGRSVDDRELPDGVYFYKLVFDQDEDVSGFLHIIRGQ